MPESHPRERSHALALCVALCLLGWAGCSASSANRDVQTAPLSDQDPPSYTPRPEPRTEGAGAGRHARDSSSEAAGVRVVGLASTAHVDAARQLALSFLAAVRINDRARFRALMGDVMFRLGARDFYRPTRPEAAVGGINRRRRSANASSNPPPLDLLLDIQSVQVTPPRPSTPGGVEGLLPSDSLVTFETTPAGRTELPTWYGSWTAQVRILVRTAGTPTVIGF